MEEKLLYSNICSSQSIYKRQNDDTMLIRKSGLPQFIFFCNLLITIYCREEEEEEGEEYSTK